MNALFATLFAFMIYGLAYVFYAKHLGQNLFRLSATRTTPAHTMNDGIDYVPTRRVVLFGHHFASITGLAPMLGPAVAVIWGWFPALLWVVFGSILIGCVHDFSALIVSARAEGKSIGKIAEGIIGKRAKGIFLVIILFGVSLAMGVFVFVIAKLFTVQLSPGKPGYPQAVMPSAAIMILAALTGYATHKKGWRLGPLTSWGCMLALASVVISIAVPTIGIPALNWPIATTWVFLLLLYALAASTLPVWALLQPRDFLNSLLLYLGLGLCFIGFFWATPGFQAPAIRVNPPGAPPLFPFVFIIIACGAVSGFHGLVSSGTTAKQLNTETDAIPIGFGAMIGESLLGLLAVLACTCGFANTSQWTAHYKTWNHAQGLATKLDAFVQGTAAFLQSLGIPHQLGATFMAVIVVSFALTTLDSATRLLRFNLEEIGESLGIRLLQNRFIAALGAVACIASFALYKIGGKPAALVLWELFGTVNQLLAGLTLLTVTLYLKQRGRNIWYTGIPTVFMLISTAIALSQKLKGFAQTGQTLLLVIGSILTLLASWLIVEGIIAFRKPQIESWKV